MRKGSLGLACYVQCPSCVQCSMPGPTTYLPLACLVTPRKLLVVVAGPRDWRRSTATSSSPRTCGASIGHTARVVLWRLHWNVLGGTGCLQPEPNRLWLAHSVVHTGQWRDATSASSSTQRDCRVSGMYSTQLPYPVLQLQFCVVVCHAEVGLGSSSPELHGWKQQEQRPHMKRAAKQSVLGS